MSDSSGSGGLELFEVPSDSYLAFARELGPAEISVRDRCLERLPPVVFDAHSHANGAAAYLGLSKWGQQQVRGSFPRWSLDDSLKVRQLLYGDRQVRFLRFAQPYRGIDHRKANAYLRAESAPGDLAALCGLPDDPEYTIGQLRAGGWAGLKMYPHYFEPQATSLTQFFPDEIVAVAAESGVPLIIHPHLPVTACLGEVLRLAGRHPQVRIILAHLGREFTSTPDLQSVWRALAEVPGVVADTSMVADSAVIRSAIEQLGPDRVLYGSDEPCNLLRYATYQHPELGQRVSSDFAYHWLREDLRRDYGHIGKGAWLMHFQSIWAVLTAVDSLAGGRDDALERAVFHDNAAAFLGVGMPGQADR